MEENKTFLDDKFIARWISGDITEEENNEFENWINKNEQHKAYFKKINKIWDNSGKVEIVEGKSEEERWKKIFRTCGF